MNAFSDISSLLFSMNEKQRNEFSVFIEKLQSEGLDSKLKEQFSEFTCDEILKSIEDITNYERIATKKHIAAEKGETTIPKENFGVHATHCCEKHGCKYGDEDCPVVLNLVKQLYPCEDCNEEKMYE